MRILIEKIVSRIIIIESSRVTRSLPDYLYIRIRQMRMYRAREKEVCVCVYMRVHTHTIIKIDERKIYITVTLLFPWRDRCRAYFTGSRSGSYEAICDKPL